MVGKANIGAVQVSPAPSAIVLNEALKLLATFGDSKSLSPLLKQMKEVQEANAELVAQVQSGKAELEKAQAAFDAERESQEEKIRSTLANLKEQAEKLISTETILKHRTARLEQQESELADHHEFTKKNFDAMDEKLNARESFVSALEQRQATRENDLIAAEAKIAERLRKLEERENSLRALLSV